VLRESDGRADNSTMVRPTLSWRHRLLATGAGVLVAGAGGVTALLTHGSDAPPTGRPAAAAEGPAGPRSAPVASPLPGGASGTSGTGSTGTTAATAPQRVAAAVQPGGTTSPTVTVILGSPGVPATLATPAATTVAGRGPVMVPPDDLLGTTHVGALPDTDAQAAAGQAAGAPAPDAPPAS
jgi:hypothetical protein